MGSTYKNLQVWQKSMDLVQMIYHLTQVFPKEEWYGLVSQMRRCAISIPSNIAEGSQRGSRKDFSHFLTIAKGSTAELETQLIISNNLNYVNEASLIKSSLELLLEVRRMISGLKNSLKDS